MTMAGTSRTPGAATTPARIANLATMMAAALVAMAMLSGCDGRRESRELLNMPDMHFSHAVKAQEPDPFTPHGAMRMPPKGTVPVNYVPYTITDAEADTVAAKLENPLPATSAVLLTGEKYYGIHCLPCHGPNGQGDGKVILALAGMPMPPSLTSEKITKQWSDGRIYHTITNGQGNMPQYRTKVSSDKRWAIIHYIRSLDLAYNTTAEATFKAPAADGAAPAASH